MNTQNNRREAIDLALRWTEVRGGAQAATSTDLVKAAAIIEAYLTGALQLRVVGDNAHGNGVASAVDSHAGGRDHINDVCPVCINSIVRRFFSFIGGNDFGNMPDQTFSAHCFHTHKASSSAQGGEKPERGATLSGAETVISRCSCDLCRRMHGTRDREDRS
ncbi:hypothetical protein MSKU9_3274 [Komagataeibacter diospyri]|uniref:Uncharacterized protein n=1 Tax=Komagataeibacter diospyri TaxID=1932662 RepID=A0A4P5NU37_9PROT|nr:hypothetical protein MSKU9_3274 [Komagataeibacter diospyri]